MGGLVGRRLEESGADVVRAHRGSGVDAVTGVGLADAIVGADVVVDCLNVTTSSGRKAIGFFAAAAGNVSRAVDAAGARLVCLSICNTADPAVNKRMGYYRGKAAQERVYRENLGDRATVVATTQWFELAATMLDRLSAGPIAMVPHMLTAPLAAVDGASTSRTWGGCCAGSKENAPPSPSTSAARPSVTVALSPILPTSLRKPRWSSGSRFDHAGVGLPGDVRDRGVDRERVIGQDVVAVDARGCVHGVGGQGEGVDHHRVVVVLDAPEDRDFGFGVLHRAEFAVLGLGTWRHHLYREADIGGHERVAGGGDGGA
jgi:hypothetical protein